MKTLNTPTEIDKALTDILFRMNSMVAYDIYEFLFEKFKQVNQQKKQRSIYNQSHIIEPAYEISIVFARQLLNFLQIRHNGTTDKLEDPLTSNLKVRPDDLFLSSLPGIGAALPLTDPLVISHESEIKAILKVANKASAHMTSSHTTGPEFLHVKAVKPVVHELCIKYVPNLPVDKLWWLKKDSMKNAHDEKDRY